MEETTTMESLHTQEIGLKQAFEEKVNRLLVFIFIGMILAVYPVLYGFTFLEWITMNDFLVFLGATLTISVVMYFINRLKSKEVYAKYLIVALLFTLPPLVSSILYSATVWAVLFLYLILSMLYLDRKVLILAGIMSVINAALIIGFNWTSINDSMDYTLMGILIAFAALAGYFVVLNGEKLIADMVLAEEESSEQSQRLNTIIATAQQALLEISKSTASLNETSHSIAHASSEVSRAVEDIASSTSTQAEDTENGANHVNTLGNLLDTHDTQLSQLTKKTTQASSLRQSSTENLKSLTKNTTDSIASIKEIERVIKSTSSSVDKIENASTQIASIAEQTNLLALNASIEAARAGEEGKGFAVVAEEIRKLAEQSQLFNEEIATVITELMREANEAVEVVDHVQTITTEQQSSLDDTNNQFKSLSGALLALEIVIKEVSVTGQDMKQKTEELIDIMQSLSATSEETASTTEEISASVTTTNQEFEVVSNEISRMSKHVKELEEVVLNQSN
jgi:methyl-accepting chemotaxis protein